MLEMIFRTHSLDYMTHKLAILIDPKFLPHSARAILGQIGQSDRVTNIFYIWRGLYVAPSEVE